MRRFLLHVLPTGFHRIRSYGLMANADRKENLARVRELLCAKPPPPPAPAAEEESIASASPAPATFLCAHCGAPMIVVDILVRCHPPRAPPRRP